MHLKFQTIMHTYYNMIVKEMRDELSTKLDSSTFEKRITQFQYEILSTIKDSKSNKNK